MPNSTVVVQKWQNCKCGGPKCKKEIFRSVHFSVAGLKRFIKSADESWQATLDFEMGHSCAPIPIGRFWSPKVLKGVIERVKKGGDGFFLKGHQIINRLK